VLLQVALAVVPAQPAVMLVRYFFAAVAVAAVAGVQLVVDQQLREEE
jgi:hypothetical protein